LKLEGLRCHRSSWNCSLSLTDFLFFLAFWTDRNAPRAYDSQYPNVLMMVEHLKDLTANQKKKKQIDGHERRPFLREKWKHAFAGSFKFVKDDRRQVTHTDTYCAECVSWHSRASNCKSADTLIRSSFHRCLGSVLA